MAGKSTSGRHSSIYVLTTADKYELPLIIGDKHEIASYAEFPANFIPMYAKHGNYIKRKYKVFMYDESLAW